MTLTNYELVLMKDLLEDYRKRLVEGTTNREIYWDKEEELHGIQQLQDKYLRYLEVS